MTDFKFKSVFGQQPTSMIKISPTTLESSSNKSSTLVTTVAFIVITGAVIFAGYQMYKLHKKEEEKKI